MSPRGVVTIQSAPSRRIPRQNPTAHSGKVSGFAMKSNTCDGEAGMLTACVLLFSTLSSLKDALGVPTYLDRGHRVVVTARARRSVDSAVPRACGPCAGRPVSGHGHGHSATGHETEITRSRGSDDA